MKMFNSGCDPLSYCHAVSFIMKALESKPGEYTMINAPIEISDEPIGTIVLY